MVQKAAGTFCSPAFREYISATNTSFLPAPPLTSAYGAMSQTKSQKWVAGGGKEQNNLKLTLLQEENMLLQLLRLFLKALLLVALS